MDDTIQNPTSLSDEETVVDGEVLPTESDVKNAEVVDESNVLTSIEELIKAYVVSLDRMRDEKKKMQEMLADGFNNDPIYKDADDKVKAATKIKSASKQQIMNKPGVIELANKLKNINSEIKEKQLAVSDYLLEYQRLANGVNQIEIENGEILEIINSAKLVRKASRRE